MDNNEVQIIDSDITDLMTSPAQSGGIMSIDTDSILQMADRVDDYMNALNKMMNAALKITCELDWVLIGGKPYLQESGATKVARLFGVSIQLLGKPLIECDRDGYKTYTYKARFMYQNQFIECEGSRGMKEDFFAKAGKDKPLKKPDEIDERDVKMAAYTNCINNGIKRLIPNLRNIDINTLEQAGLDVSKIKGYTFKDGKNGGASKAAEDSDLTCEHCGKEITQKVASYSQGKFGKMLCFDCQKGAAENV